MKNGCKNHDRCVGEITTYAERVCSERGVALTPLRKRVLRIVSRSHRPVKAYKVLSELSRSAKPPTVYRTLDFLIENGLVHKLSSMSSYCACFHPSSGHSECFFLICSDCGESREFCGSALSKAVDSAVTREGFSKVETVLEVRGTCLECGRRKN
ncbi:MAG: transcriptional repressor [Candidatus Mycalebacterium zealandia]|nr:MAG: transcriptional repressor [Candidatus Mycalebacterium zealandia]